jgi:hypothetical protein
MLCPKKVTEKKVVANRKNAKNSTGPRTERGKDMAKFNAVVSGLFARHIVIPLIDDAEVSDYATLVTNLFNDLRPQSTLEEFFVLEIAKATWKIRRADLAENASARKNVFWDKKAPEVEAFVREYRTTLEILKAAEEEAIATGKLSASTYDAVVNVIRVEYPNFVSHRQLAQNNAKEAQETAGPSVIVDDIFLSHLKVRRTELSRLFEVNKDLAEEWAKDYYLSRAVPESEIMEKIFRYEKAARRNLERAYASLTDLQERRKKDTGLS